MLGLTRFAKAGFDKRSFATDKNHIVEEYLRLTQMLKKTSLYKTRCGDHQTTAESPDLIDSGRSLQSAHYYLDDG